MIDSKTEPAAEVRYHDPAALDRDMVQVPGGGFLYGMTAEEKQRAAADAGVHPDQLRDHSDRRVLKVAGFWMDRYPVTRGQFARFLKATGHQIIRNGWVVGWRELTESWPPDRPGMEALPMIGINAEDAESYARWAGKRLPTEAEWELAARGTDGRFYPWGNEPSTNACYQGQGNIPFSASFPVGSWPAGASPCGAQDMVGLVCQYVRAIEGPSSHLLAGSSVFHAQPYSRMVTARFGWVPEMRNYVSGFRCAADVPPPGGAAPAAYRPGPRVLPRPLAIRRDAYLKEAITLQGTETTTLEIRVPWFPESVWLVDVPETGFGPFPGANMSPGDPDTAVAWKIAPDGQRAAYVREKGDQRFAFEARVEGNRVRFAFDTRNIPRADHIVEHCCMKTLSPFFSSQERMTQGIIHAGRFLRVADMPVGFRPNGGGVHSVGTRQPFYWAVEEKAPEVNHGALRSYDGSAFVARVNPVPCQAWGNSSIPCMHLVPGGPMPVQSGSVIFFIGSAAELEKEMNTQYPTGNIQTPG